MKIFIYIGGKDKRDWSVHGVEHYIRLLKQFAEVNIVTYSPVLLKSKKAILLFDRRPEGCPFVVLDSRGKVVNTYEFAKLVSKLSEKEGRLAFFIGGPDGFPNEIIKASDNLISLSKLTFGHRLTLVILLEQLYRTFDLRSKSKFNR